MNLTYLCYGPPKIDRFRLFVKGFRQTVRYVAELQEGLFFSRFREENRTKNVFAYCALFSRILILVNRVK